MKNNLKYLNKAISFFKGRKQFCEAMDITLSNLWNWEHRQKQCPVKSCFKIEEVTGGFVTKEQLRSDVYR